MNALEQEEMLTKALKVWIDPDEYYRRLKKDYDAPENLNSEICAECKGECCKRCGCNFSPDDFKKITFKALKAEIEKGYISIEYLDQEMFDLDFSAYVLRVRNRGRAIVDVGFNRSPCILLTEQGCKLSFDQRPTGGKLLRPSRELVEYYGKKVRNCPSKYTIAFCCHEWKPYQKILRQLAKYFEDKDFECSL